MRHVAVAFVNVGGYHAARLEAAAEVLAGKDWTLTAVQSSDVLPQYPWGDVQSRLTVPVSTLLPVDRYPGVDVLGGSSLAAARMGPCLDGLRPDAVAIAGWGYPEMRAALRWCRRNGVAAILLSESKADDTTRHWWKERVKAWMWVRRFDAALVGGRAHTDYLLSLGFPSERITTGYDVVDNGHFAVDAEAARRDPNAVRARHGIPDRTYFICSSRIIPRKNIVRLVRSYALYRRTVGSAWDLVICGTGEDEAAVRSVLAEEGIEAHVHLPGFVPYHALGAWYGLAEALVHPALSEPWGLAVNEACASGLPILCSRTVGARYDLVHEGRNGVLFDPLDTESIAGALHRVHEMSPEARRSMGEASRMLVRPLGVERFGLGLIQALHLACVGERAA